MKPPDVTAKHELKMNGRKATSSKSPCAVKLKVKRIRHHPKLEYNSGVVNLRRQRYAVKTQGHGIIRVRLLASTKINNNITAPTAIQLSTRGW